MIEKGIVEKVEDKYTLRIRIPKLHRMGGDAFSTPTNDLSIGVPVVYPNIDVLYNVGDIVVVEFDEATYEEVYVLGILYRNNIESNSCTSPTLESLNVNVDCSLPKETSIGNVSAKNIQNLEGARDNLQQQIDLINDKLNKLMSDNGGNS